MSINVPPPLPQDPTRTLVNPSAEAVEVLHSGPPAIAPGMDTAPPPRSMFRRGLEVFTENRLALIGLGLLVVIFLFAFVAPIFYHTNQVNTNLLGAYAHPGSPGHPLGTDNAGYDELGRLMQGTQISLELGLASAVVATVIGTLWGAVAGYVGGWIDAIMMRVVDAALAIPLLFLLIVLATIIHPTKITMILIISMASWLGISRLVRGEALSLRVREYVQAVRVMGGGGTRIVLRHIAPNAVGTIIVNATFQVADAILFIAAISFLGLGLTPPAVDLGGMLSTGVQFADDGYWWLIYPAGAMIVLIVIAVNFVGDALRDAFEVRLQRR
ncbi:MAG TPA: ABC transporter permease [Streptosporangiaceae bacterium]|jgi:peptide/nickel transport system permease protein